jgi:DNA-binding CsgD family transcriptional regulator/PAS domain-containing protein
MSVSGKLPLEDGFAAAVEAIYDAAAAPSEWPRALQAIADCLHDVGALLIWQRDDAGFGVIVSPCLQEAQQDYEANGWFRRDIRAIRAVEQAYWIGGDAVTDQHCMSDEEINTDPYYTQFLARHGLRWCAAMGVSPDPHVSVALSVQRASTKPPYSEPELELVARLGRHAEKSLRLSMQLMDTAMASVGLGEALSRVGMGVFVLDGLGRIVFSNPAAVGLIGDGLQVVGQRLTTRFPAERQILDDAVSTMISERPDDRARETRPILIPRSSCERPLTVYVLPLRSSGDRLTDRFLARARAIVLVIDARSDQPPDPAVVRDVLGLTLSEARVAAMVGSGLPPRDAAVKLGIAEQTARTALKRVFMKVGVSRQSELAALLSKLVLR